MRYIFLDIDGVIAVPQSDPNMMWTLSHACQSKLGRIIEDTSAKLVISSTWRHETIHETIEALRDNGFIHTDHIIGVTIKTYDYVDRHRDVRISIPRGLEIKHWLDSHANPPYRYVILDDQTDMLYHQKDNFIHTDSSLGLTDHDVRRAINILMS